MNKAAITKHDIYNKLIGFTEQDLNAIANFIDFMRHKKQLEEKKVLKLQDILKGYDIDFSDLKKFKKQAWEHLEQSFSKIPWGIYGIYQAKIAVAGAFWFVECIQYPAKLRILSPPWLSILNAVSDPILRNPRGKRAHQFCKGSSLPWDFLSDSAFRALSTITRTVPQFGNGDKDRIRRDRRGCTLQLAF